MVEFVEEDMHPALTERETIARGTEPRARRVHPTMQPAYTDTEAPNKRTVRIEQQFEQRRRAVPTVEKDREFQCDTCKSRCTRDPDGSMEYGHKYNCPERSPELPRGGAGGGAWYDGGDDE